MNKVELGKTGMMITPVGLGCMGFSHAYGQPVKKEEAIAKIRKAYEMGYNFFDTAESYTGVFEDGSVSNNEELVGEALKDVRDQVIIASKFGVAHNEDHSLRLDSSPQTIRKSIEGSLKRLQTDHVDLYYQHRIDPNTEPEEVAAVMKELMEEGKIKAWGISETDEEYLRRAHAICPVSAIQNRYSMMARWHENLFPVCKELGITYVAYSPLANGILTGTLNPQSKFDGKEDYRSSMPQFTEEGFAKAQALLALLEDLSARKGCSQSQLSLAWMMHKDVSVVPIPGSRKLERLQENLESANVDLSDEEVRQIDALLDGMDFDVFGDNKAK